MTIIQPNSIMLNSDATTPQQVFAQLAKLAKDIDCINDINGFISALAEREQQMSTGFGNGIAIPHAKSTAVNQPGVIVLRTEHMMEWSAIDDLPVNCFICLMSPENGNNEHLSMISKLSRRLIYPEFIEFIQQEDDAQKIYQQLHDILHG